MCKRSDTFSLAILIGRGLDLVNLPKVSFLTSFSPFPLFVQFSGYIAYAPLDSEKRKRAPLAQLGEVPKRRRWRMK